MIEKTRGWDPGSLAAILHNPTYKGGAAVKSRHGRLERPAPALVDAATWDKAQLTLTRNRALSGKNAKRNYLLRGLVRCQCGMTYVGSVVAGKPGYRCNANVIQASGRTAGRCNSSWVSARILERVVWQEVRGFVDHPEEHITEAQRRLRERLADVSQSEDERRRLGRELAGKELERERVLDLFRRGRITAAECDRDLDKVAAEAHEIRVMLDSLQARAAMTAASEAYLSDVGAAVSQMRGRMEEIERTNDYAAMREQIELLAPSIVIQTEVLGVRESGRQIKRKRALVTLAYRSNPAVVSITPRPSSNRTSRDHLRVALRVGHKLTRGAVTPVERAVGRGLRDRSSADAREPGR